MPHNYVLLMLYINIIIKLITTAKSIAVLLGFFKFPCPYVRLKITFA